MRLAIDGACGLSWDRCAGIVGGCVRRVGPAGVRRRPGQRRRGGRRAGPGGADLARASSSPSGPRPPIATPPGSGTSRLPIPTATRPATPRRSGYRYGLHPAPYPNDGLPHGPAPRDRPRRRRRPACRSTAWSATAARSAARATSGWATPSSTCKALLFELTIADGRRPPFSTFVLNSSRGTNNAGKVAAVLLEPAQPRPLVPLVPAAAGGQPPRDGHPRLVAPEAQADDVLRRPHRRPLGPDQHAVPAGREEPRGVQGAGADLPRHPGFPQEPRAAQVSRSRSTRRRPRAARSSSRRRASAATAPTDPDGKYPNKIVPLDVIGTDPARSHGLSDRLVAHYNTTWLGAEHPVEHQARRLPGPAARRHLGHRPLLAQRLGPDPARPARSRRPGPGGSPAPPRPTSSTTTRPTSAGSSPRSPPTSWPRRPAARRFRPSSSSTPPASAWATAATPSATSSPKTSGWT